MRGAVDMLTRRQMVIALGRGLATMAAAHYLTACTEQESFPALAPELTDSPLMAYALGLEAISYSGIACLAPLGYAGSTAPHALQIALHAQLSHRLWPAAEGAAAASPAPLPPAVIAERVDRAIREDFANEELIDLQGWQLARTECALAALAASARGMVEAVAPAQAEPVTSHIADITGWGPQSTVQGEGFNAQPDGHSGLWFRAQQVPASAVILFDGNVQATQVYADLLTSGLHDPYRAAVINVPGEYPVALFDRARNIMQPIGVFQVRAATAAAPPPADIGRDACQVESWGPALAVSGQPFNPQPGGASAFWVHTDCAKDDSKLLLDGIELDTTAQENLLTALVPHGHDLAPGRYPLSLRLGDSDKYLEVGFLTVE